MFNKSEQKSQKNINRKNRKYSILLLALLFIGVATYGTYAYFTDSKSIDGQLTLTKGQVSLGDAKAQEWTYQGNSEAVLSTSFDKYNANLWNGEEYATSTNRLTGSSFSNVLPGDTFTTTIDIKYTGSVDATGTIALNTDKISRNIDYVVLFNNGGSNEELTSNEPITFSADADKEETKKLTFTLIVHVPYDSNEENLSKEGRNNGSNNNFLDNLTDAITVSVQQKLESNN